VPLLWPTGTKQLPLAACLPAAVLESRAFGGWCPPDYKALAAADAAEYAALRAAASGTGGGAKASPAAAALPAPPVPPGAAAAVAAAAAQRPQLGGPPPATPPAAKKPGGSGGEEVDEAQAAAVAAALASPPPTPAQMAVERRVADWLERELLPAVHRQASRNLCCVQCSAPLVCPARGLPPAGMSVHTECAAAMHVAAVQGDNGWDLLAAVQDVKKRAKAAQEGESFKAAEAVEARIKDVRPGRQCVCVCVEAGSLRPAGGALHSCLVSIVCPCFCCCPRC
jgi:hypothetical protein